MNPQSSAKLESNMFVSTPSVKMNEELLIDLVRQNEFLYDPNHQDYSNRPAVKSCWDNIGTTMGHSGDECKKRWNSLRDRFRRVKNTKSEKTNGGSSTKWKFEDQMSFLNDFLQEKRQKTTQFGEEAYFQDDGEFSLAESILAYSEHSNEFTSVTQSPSGSQSPSPYAVTCQPEKPVPKRRPYEAPRSYEGSSGSSTSQMLAEYLAAKKMKPAVEKDNLGKFFDAMESTVRTFKPALQVQVKAKISALVSEFEMMSLNEEEVTMVKAESSW